MGKTILWIVVIIIVIAGGWWLIASHSGSGMSDTSSMQMATSTDMGTASSTMPAAMSATVTYDGTSFSPASVTVMQGGTVTFTDQSSQPFWVASDPHPIHNGYDGTTLQQHCAQGYTGPAPFDECASGTGFTFTFDKVGSWGYHDHLNPNAGGTVVVVGQ